MLGTATFVFESEANRSAARAGRRTAAVALAILEVPPHGVIFIERAAHLRDHPGQIALPGGSVDPGDGGDLRRTALRELREEVGVGPERVRIVGELPVVRQTRANNFDVTPFVAVVAPGPLTIDGTETAAVFTIPLAVVVEQLTQGTHTIGELIVETYLLDYESRRVWGLTGHILRRFVEAWTDPANALRAAVEAALVA
ncbi:MAG TPA: CoA pyrophosphatase [Candidatus Elarobacter sp.]|jgi:8-oxo-dGTP pyrophosphatase MutT (NUDIX family)